jgi:hypothetical protein
MGVLGQENLCGEGKEDETRRQRKANSARETNQLVDYGGQSNLFWFVFHSFEKLPGKILAA